jgi:putative transcriptional regulator
MHLSRLVAGAEESLKIEIYQTGLWPTRCVMPILVNLDNVFLKWQSDHNERLTYAELARRAGISLATLNRIKANDISKVSLKKINRLCKVLECEPGDIFKRVDTKLFAEQVESGNTDLQRLLGDIERARADE